MKITKLLLSGFLAMGVTAAQAQEVIDCESVASEVTTEIIADEAEVLNIVSERVGEFPSCACEIVKAAIEATEAEKDLVGEIVYVSVMAAPERWELIAQCALAVAPDAFAEINAALIRAGQSGFGNPLDFPGGGELFANSGAGSPGFQIQPNQNLKVVTDPGPPETSPHYNYPRWRFGLPIDFR